MTRQTQPQPEQHVPLVSPVSSQFSDSWHFRSSTIKLNRHSSLHQSVSSTFSLLPRVLLNLFFLQYHNTLSLSLWHLNLILTWYTAIQLFFKFTIQHKKIEHEMKLKNLCPAMSFQNEGPESLSLSKRLNSAILWWDGHFLHHIFDVFE